MDKLFAVCAFCTIIWYIVDRVKVAWSNLSYGKWLTVAAACLLSCLCVFSYGLDAIVALGVAEEMTITGQIFTVLIFTGGSSLLSEIIKAIKDRKDNEE